MPERTKKCIEKFIFFCIVSCSFIGGYFVGKTSTKRKIITAGKLNIDRSEEDEPEKLFMELDIPFEQLKTGEFAVFEISRKNYLKK